MYAQYRMLYASGSATCVHEPSEMPEATRRRCTPESYGGSSKKPTSRSAVCLQDRD